MKPQLFYPIKPAFITQQFGVNAEYYQKHIVDENGKPLIRAHNGIDFDLNDRKIGHFAHNGTIDQFYVDGMGGLGIVVVSDDEYDYQGLKAHMKTIYWHLDYVNKSKFQVGQKVTIDDTYICDSTGFSTGPHLHFGLKFCVRREEMTWQNVDYGNGYLGAVDPMPYFVNFYAQDGTIVISTLQKIVNVFNQILSGLKNNEKVAYN